MGVHGAHGALDADELVTVARFDPELADLQIDDIAFFQIDDLIGDSGQRHRIRGEEVLIGSGAEDQRRADPGADDAVRLVAAEHRDRVSAFSGAAWPA